MCINDRKCTQRKSKLDDVSDNIKVNIKALECRERESVVHHSSTQTKRIRD